MACTPCRGGHRGRRWLALALVVVLLPLAGCGDEGAPVASALCPSGETLRVGLVAQAEGVDASEVAQAQDPQVPALRQLLISASRCEVDLEPVRSPELARRNLEQGQWDLAFLPPGLTAFALAGGRYRALRSLGRPGDLRPLIVAAPQAGLRHVSQLEGRRLGLLPRGSLQGFYLPLYDLHGLRLAKVVYGLSFEDLAGALRANAVDAIAWESRRPLPMAGSRVLLRDRHAVPPGALVLRSGLPDQAAAGFLATLDETASQLPAFIGYNPSTVPAPSRMLPLQRIVRTVESWPLPADGATYRVGPSPTASR